MAHELTIRQDGKVECAWAGAKPWHGLGTEIKAGTSPVAALTAAGLDWNAIRKDLFFRGGGDVFNAAETKVPDRFAIVRSDNGAYLGNVGRTYRPVQNREQAEFIEALVGEGNASVECCGSLFGGAKQFWTVKVGETAIEAEKRADVLRQYMIVANCHDGSGTFKSFWSPTRVVCNNTLRAALSKMADGVSIRHTTNVKERIAAAKLTLGICAQYYDALGNAFQKMAETRIEREQYDDILARIFAPVVLDGADQAKRLKAELEAKQTIATITDNLRTEAKMFNLTRITAWDAYNSVTHYSSHQMTSRKSRTATPNEQRFERVLFGDGQRVQSAAFAAFGQLAGVN